jgi:hypothetical protein
MTVSIGVELSQPLALADDSRYSLRKDNSMTYEKAAEALVAAGLLDQDKMTAAPLF